MRKVILHFALKYEGNYNKIYEALKNKELVSKEDLDAAESKINCKYVTIADPDYPKRLKDCPKPPFILFYYGDFSLLENCNTVAVIGTRNNSYYGEEMAKKIVKGLKDYKAVVISGMAIGCDSIAQYKAIESKMKTVAVLGSGIDCIYPASNYALYNMIKTKGLVISEYPNKTKAEPKNFLIRNRLIAALSDKIVVIEAKYRSGTMNTVSYALEMGKDIYCVPYPANEESGCNFLIKEGAKLAECAKDLYE